MEYLSSCVGYWFGPAAEHNRSDKACRLFTWIRGDPDLDDALHEAHVLGCEDRRWHRGHPGRVPGHGFRAAGGLCPAARVGGRLAAHAAQVCPRAAAHLARRGAGGALRADADCEHRPQQFQHLPDARLGEPAHPLLLPAADAGLAAPAGEACPGAGPAPYQCVPHRGAADGAGGLPLRDARGASEARRCPGCAGERGGGRVHSGDGRLRHLLPIRRAEPGARGRHAEQAGHRPAGHRPLHSAARRGAAGPARVAAAPDLLAGGHRPDRLAGPAGGGPAAAGGAVAACGLWPAGSAVQPAEVQRRAASVAHARRPRRELQQVRGRAAGRRARPRAGPGRRLGRRYAVRLRW
mmetsp:Transcript_96179/g.261215  ORF Transcript_96179/g.261215 Transcript_96179/m.261215 type:complete len:351 (-) Transcript_96179:596-1648(-)